MKSVVSFVIAMGGLVISTPSAHAEMVLGTELSSAMCALNPPYRNLRQCVDGRATTINFFRVTNQPCRNQRYNLTPLQETMVSRIIPDGNVRRQIWQNYGRCSGMSPNNYFRKMTSLATGLRMPAIVMDNKTYRVSNVGFMQQLIAHNPGLPMASISLYCQRNRSNQSILTYINTCYDNDGRYSRCSQLSASCPSQFYILGLR